MQMHIHSAYCILCCPHADQIFSKLPAGNNMLSRPCVGNGCNISDMNHQKIHAMGAEI